VVEHRSVATIYSVLLASSNNYWSSTESDSNNAYNVNTNNGNVNNNNKNNSLYVRASLSLFIEIIFVNIIEPMLPSFHFEYVTFEELYCAYLDCRKRKRHTANAAAFEINLTENLYKLWIELNQKKYEIGKSIVFIIDKPVKREVFAADFRDRIIHHLIINRIMPHFEKEVIDNTFSCRVGKGTLCAVKTLEKQAVELSNNYSEKIYVLKCDLKSFFMSISKELLYDKISNLIKTKVHPNDKIQSDYLCWLTRLVIMDEPQNKCKFKQPRSKWNGLPREKSLFNLQSGYGLPIGNLNSQIFANYLLDNFDKFIISTLKFSCYGRYVDDFYILDGDKERLLSAIPLMRDKLMEIGIMLHPKKIYLQEISKGVKFVGGVIKPNRTYISNRTKANLYSMIHKSYVYVTNNSPSIDDIQYFISSINSYFGYLKHHNTYKLRNKILKSNEIKPWYKYCYIHNTLLKLVSYREYNLYKRGIRRGDVVSCSSDYRICVNKIPLIVI